MNIPLDRVIEIIDAEIERYYYWCPEKKALRDLKSRIQQLEDET